MARIVLIFPVPPDFSMNNYYAGSITSEGSLHRPELERDACGVGFVASVKGLKSNKILKMGTNEVLA